MDYPIVFDQCPICHATQKVVKHEVDQEKEKGKIPEDRIACSQQRILPIMDFTGPRISAPVLFIYKDICANCGYEHNVYIERRVMADHEIRAFMTPKIPLRWEPPSSG